ncbi:QWRF motif-containing protein 3 [Humulus lupulus]|uniref:QWRF motif-containing protein 3 n=1 Tax=Humulus lupulus TaxID=3486 RepID=UPI002B401E27|nr:QWRF motif-containing protein 3 [Humulus lupulus]
MKKHENESLLFSDSVKPRKPKSREVGSRFLSPTSTSLLETGIPSPTQGVSPVRRKPGSSTFPEIRKNRPQLEEHGYLRGLWPSSITTTTTTTTSSSSSSSSANKFDTLADHLGNDRLNDLLERKSSAVFDRQRSSRETNRFENDKESSKENHRPIFGGSMRYYTGSSSSRFSGKVSSSKVFNTSSSDIVPGRLSVDENALHQKPSRRMSDSFAEALEYSDGFSSTDHFGSSLDTGKSSRVRKSGVEVSSKYMNDIGTTTTATTTTRSRRGTTDSNITSNPVSLDRSPRLGKLSIKNAIKRANSLTSSGYGSGGKSQWALSPGRSSSPSLSVENKGKLQSFSSMKPPTNSPSKTKGVDKFLSMSLGLFKSKNHSSHSSSTTTAITNSNSSASNSLPGGYISTEASHQLRVLHNRLMQWRYANARADAVDFNIATHVKINLSSAWDGLTKLQHSVVQKRIQLQKEKLEMKLNFILQSEFKLLEAWGDMERQHLASVSTTKDCLNSVVCKVPLIEGAKVDVQSASLTFRHASDLTSAIKSMLTTFSPSAGKIGPLISDLAEVVAQERLLLEECLELFRTISILELKERHLKSSVIQMEFWQQQQQEKQMPQRVGLALS